MSVLRAPLLHFLAGGFLLFALARSSGSPPAAYGARPGDPITITAADVERLRSDYTRETGLAVTPEDEVALIDTAIAEELLFREALARGLDRNDRSVRTWLVQQMQVLSDGEGVGGDAGDLYARALALGLDRTDLVVRRILIQKMRLLAERSGETVPDDDVLRAFYASHRDEYRAPDRFSFWQVFFASQRGAPTADAAALHARLRAQPTAPRDAARDGDAFIAPPHLVGQSATQIAKLFGADFGTALQDAPVGEWLGPIASPYGAHLVWIDERVAGAPPAFEAVRGQVLERWQSEQRAVRRAQLLRELRTRHPLQVDSAAWRQREAS